MKTIGLIGGTSWLSTVDYYRELNEGVNRRLGDLNSAKILLYSVNFEEYRPTEKTDWVANGRRLGAIARHLQDAGADCLLLCANTLHVMAETIQSCIDIPIIHIVTETAAVIREQGLHKVALLGTRYTMEFPFFREKLREAGIEALVPGAEDRTYINGTIFDELNKGIFLDSTRQRYLQIIDELTAQGAQGVILGCTEFPILIKPKDCKSPLFDTTAIHAAAGVRFALG